MKRQERWYSQRVQQEMHLVRWGEVGTPVLLLATAGGDAEECERFQIIDSLAPLLWEGRIKVYSVDSLAGRTWLEKRHSSRHCSWLQNAFQEALTEEVVPAIRADCGGPRFEVLAAGASIGAFNAAALLCRRPDLFRAALCMSGTFDLSSWLNGDFNDDFYFSSPLHFLPSLDGDVLWRLRQRFVLLAFGEGPYENPGESWRLADLLGSKGIPNRVDNWGPDYRHDWPTWRNMLPVYLRELTN